MADTIQVVQWALGQKCRLRQGPDWENPQNAQKTLSYCQTYSSLLRNQDRGFGVFGDVCVNSITPALAGDKHRHYYCPSGGFVLSAQFSPLGGLPSLHQLCGDCPANDDAGGLAGCAGAFYPSLDPYSKELQEQLDRLIIRLGLAQKLHAIFPATKLHWFRFWINSPVPAEGAVLLHQLFEAVSAEDDSEQTSFGVVTGRGSEELRHFVRSLTRSINANIPLHVSLAPLGHTDFGWYTIFPHCPRCKAKAPVKLWQRNYRDEEIACAICGEKFSPAKHRSSVRDKWDPKNLREVLGPAGFEETAVRCLMAQGASEAEAGQVLREHEAAERARDEKWRREAEASRRHQAFVEKVIYHGLDNLGDPRGEDGPKWLFSSKDLEEIFRRCESHGGRVLHISHVSKSGEPDELVQMSWLTSARRALRQLRKKGCDEKFSIHMKIPQAAVERWHQQGNP